VCGAPDRERLFVKDGWPIVRCASCSLVFVDAALDRAALDSIYGRQYYEGGAYANYLAERDVRLASARDRTRWLTSIVQGGNLLDIGCAAGFFLEAASDRYAATGVEVSAFASQYARDELGLRVFTGEIFDAPLADGEFDVVTMWDVVEHLADPRAVLSEVARVSCPGALLVLSTGNVEGPIARRDLEGWDLMFPPGHMTFFSPRTLGLLLERSGFTIDRIVADGRVSHRPRLEDARAQGLLGTLGLGNVMTILARRSDRPRRRLARARVPSALAHVVGLASARPRPADRETWLRVAQQCSYATFFHTPMWRELALACAGACHDASFAVTLPSGGEAIFPLQELLPRHGRGRYLLSTFPYGYGGPIADGTLTAADLRMLFLYARAATTTVTGNPFIHHVSAPAGWTAETVTTQVLDLEPGYETLRKGFSKGHRAAITQAGRNGVSARVASSLEDYRAYYSVYENSLRRWGDAAGRRYPRSLFEAGWQLAQRHPDAVRLWLADHGGEPVAGAWVFSWNGRAMYWHAAALERAFELRPMNLVLAAAIEDACDRGYRVFDFGSSGGHAGTEAFKRRFGASERSLTRWEHVTPVLQVTGALRRGMAGFRPEEPA
jgi:SAM-dependent methyltransferase